MTIGERYGPLMAIEDQAEADAAFARLVADLEARGYTRGQAEAIEQSNIAYYAAYHDLETFGRVTRLFRADRPLFGRTWPGPEDGSRSGRDRADA